MNVDYSAILNNVMSFCQEATTFIYAVSMVAWIIFTFMALVKKGSRQGDNEKSTSWGAIFWRLFIGSCLCTLALRLQDIIATNGDVGAIRNGLAYVQTNGQQSALVQLAWATGGAFLVFMGTAAFFRGFLLFDKASQGAQDAGDLFWRGLWHIVGGSVLIMIFT